MRNKWILGWLVVGTLCLFSGTGEEAVAEYIAPVRGQMQLTGTFGELRGGHFHAGLDIRGPVGRPVYAIADGFISRIVISAAGYGQALYLDHPTGHTSLYGHLDQFTPAVADFVKQRQYALESFALDEEVDPVLFPVQQGDLIGYIGKRGYAFGPHLHFEVRDTRTQDPLNPMAYGITVPDTRRPFVNEVRLYELDERGNAQTATTYATQYRGGGRYRTATDTLWVNRASFGLAFKAYDQQNGVNNWNGIHALRLLADDSLRFQFAMQHFSFAETRYINAHLDFEEQTRHKSWFHRSFLLPGNRLSLYDAQAGNGRLSLSPGQSTRVRTVVEDFAGNEARVDLIVKRTTDEASLINKTYTYFLPFDEESIIDNGSVRAHFPEGCFYEDLYMNYDLLVEESDNLGSSIHRLEGAEVPVHHYFDIHIRPNEIPEAKRHQALIAYCADGQEPRSYGGEWTEEGRLWAPVRDLGNYSILLDDEAPQVNPERLAEDMRGWEAFSFLITDNFLTSGSARDLRFRAEVDGQWLLMEYDYKSDRLFHRFDGTILPGQHTLLLTVQDDRGNETVVEHAFIR